MEAPFELPIKADEELLMLHIQGKLCASLIIGDVNNWDDEARLSYLRYIVLCVNSRDALLDTIRNALASLVIINMPIQEGSLDVATNEELLSIMAESFKAVLALAEK